jgi:hypothetical protein
VLPCAPMRRAAAAEARAEIDAWCKARGLEQSPLPIADCLEQFMYRGDPRARSLYMAAYEHGLLTALKRNRRKRQNAGR